MLKNKTLMERILHMWPVKVLSLGAAVLLFFFTNLLNLENRVITLPIRYALAPGYTQAHDYPTKVRIKMRGNADKIFGVAEEDLQVTADFSTFSREGEFKVPLAVKRSGNAALVEPLDIALEPGAVSISLEHSLSREVPINVRFSGNPKPGYQMISYSITPSNVQVVGPASKVVAVNSVETEIVDLSVHAQDFSQVVRLESPDSLVRPVTLTNLELRVGIGQAVNKKVFPGLPLVVIGLAAGLSIDQPLPVGSVTIQADSEALALLDVAQIRMLVDASQIKAAGIYQLKIICDSPPHSLVLSVDPLSVNLTVTQTVSSERSQP